MTVKTVSVAHLSSKPTVTQGLKYPNPNLEMMKQKRGLQWEKIEHLKLAQVTLEDGPQIAVTEADQSQIDRTLGQKDIETLAMANDIRSATKEVLNGIAGPVALTLGDLSKTVANKLDIAVSTAETHLIKWLADKDDLWLKNLHSDHIKCRTGRTQAVIKVVNYYGQNN